MTDYHLVVLDLAARSCVKAGLRRQRAVLEFMAAFDRASEAAYVERSGPVAVVRELQPEDFTDGIGSQLSAKAMRVHAQKDDE